MTDELRMEVQKLYLHRVSIREIGRRLGLHPHSVRWVLKRGEMLRRERERRVAKGATREYACSKCGKTGHTVTSCGVERA